MLEGVIETCNLFFKKILILEKVGRKEISTWPAT